MLIGNRQITGSNLGWDIKILTRFSSFSSVLPGSHSTLCTVRHADSDVNNDPHINTNLSLKSREVVPKNSFRFRSIVVLRDGCCPVASFHVVGCLQMLIQLIISDFHLRRRGYRMSSSDAGMPYGMHNNAKLK